MNSIIDAFILLLVIMDPVASMPAFLSTIRWMKPRQARKIALKAVLVAAFVFYLFAFGGDFVLKLLNVSLDSFRVAGGIILAILGIQMVMGISFPKKGENISQSAVIIGTPLISGPAVITTAIILSGTMGVLPTSLAGGLALAVMYAFLMLAIPLSRLLGMSGLKVLSTMMGIVTMAWGIQFIITGITGIA